MKLSASGFQKLRTKLDLYKQRYEQNKKDIESNSKLSFYDYKEDLNLRLQNLELDSKKFYILRVVALVILIAFAVCNNAITQNNFLKVLLVGVVLILVLIMIFFSFSSYRDYIISKYKTFSIFVFQIPVLLGLFLIYLVFDQKASYSFLGIILISLFLLLCSEKFFKFLPLYLIDTFDKNVTVLLTVSTLLLAPYLSAHIGVICVSYLLNITIMQIRLNCKLKKSQLEAEEIFENVLLSDNDGISDDDNKLEYQKLLVCYAKGGDKYKEKILSDREFLKLIKHFENV
ncbi:hypothetical protein Si024_01060 [Streptococcus infantarius subsp. infantarius]|nr:hypothetical protein [Streptococcus infantarius subsp. infantarius]